MSGSKEPDKAESVTSDSPALPATEGPSSGITRITPHEAVTDDPHEGADRPSSADEARPDPAGDPQSAGHAGRRLAPESAPQATPGTMHLASGTTVSSAVSSAMASDRPASEPEALTEKPEPEPAGTAADKDNRTARPAGESVPAAAAHPPRRGGFWPVFLGGVVAAGIGAGAAWWAIPHLPPAWQPALPADSDAGDRQALKDEILAELAADGDEAALPDADMLRDRIAGALAEYRDEIDEMVRATAADEVKDRFDALEVDGNAAPEELALALAEQEKRLDRLEEEMAGLTEARSQDTAEPTDPAGGPAAGASTMPAETAKDDQPAEAPQAEALDAIRTEVATLREGLAALEARPLPEPGADPADLAALDQRVSDMDQGIADIAGRIDRVESRLIGLDAVAQLSAALRSGDEAGREAASAALEQAGMTEAAELARTAPALKELQDRYDDAARRALAATRAAGEGADHGGGIAGFFNRRTNVRAVTPREGDDPDAIQSRAGARLADGDVAAALDELAAMPEPGRDAMADWLRDAEIWVEADTVMKQITQPANSGD